MKQKYWNNNATEGCDCRCGEDSCIYPKIKIEGIIYLRKYVDYERGERCHDCDVLNGGKNVHHLGCDGEICPKCGEQLIICGCHLEELINDEKSMKIKYVEGSQQMGFRTWTGKSLMECINPKKFEELSRRYKGKYLTEICGKESCFMYPLITDSKYDIINLWKRDNQKHKKGGEFISSSLTIQL